MEIGAAMQEWLDEVVGELAAPLPVGERVEMALHGAAIANLANQVMLAETGAQLSCIGIANRLPGFERMVKMRDILANYPFNDAPVVLEVTGEVLRKAMERCASYLDVDENGEPQVASRFLLPELVHHDYDFFAGITFTADLSKPVGGRVINITYQERTVRMDEKFSVAMTENRAAGKGGYPFYAQCLVLYRGQTPINEMIRHYISARQGQVTEVTRYPVPMYIF